MNTKKSDRAYTYMLRCKDNTIYTGITKDLTRRMQEHAEGGKKCAKYTRTHGFSHFEIAFEVESWSLAARLEYQLKHLSKEKKEALILNPSGIQLLTPEAKVVQKEFFDIAT